MFLGVAGAMSAQETAKMKVGDKLPVLEGPDDTGKTWKSTDVVGKKILVLYFFPADTTKGCTSQACAYRDDLGKLKDAEVEVVGISGDTVENHKVFRKLNELNFTLVSDEKGAFGKKLGIPFTPGEK